MRNRVGVSLLDLPFWPESCAEKKSPAEAGGFAVMIEAFVNPEET